MENKDRIEVWFQRSSGIKELRSVPNIDILKLKYCIESCLLKLDFTDVNFCRRLASYVIEKVIRDIRNNREPFAVRRTQALANKYVLEFQNKESEDDK